MSDNFIHNFSKYIPLVLTLSFCYLIAPTKIKIIKNIKFINGKRFSISLNDVAFIIFVIFVVVITLKCLKK